MCNAIAVPWLKPTKANDECENSHFASSASIKRSKSATDLFKLIQRCLLSWKLSGNRSLRALLWGVRKDECTVRQECLPGAAYISISSSPLAP
jgi:hypothetical protein